MDAAVNDEQQKQVSANVTVRNIITSMRRMSDVDWTEIFERVSLVDAVLADGCGFAEMDFPTRNLYRTAVEELARGSGLSELEIARRAVLTGAQAAPEALEARRPPNRSWLLSLRGGRVRVRSGNRISPTARLVRRFYRTLGIGAISARRDRRRAPAGDADHRPCSGQPGLDMVGNTGNTRGDPSPGRSGCAREPGLTHRFGRPNCRVSNFAMACPNVFARSWSCRPC